MFCPPPPPPPPFRIQTKTPPKWRTVVHYSIASQNFLYVLFCPSLEIFSEINPGRNVGGAIYKSDVIHGDQW